MINRYNNHDLRVFSHLIPFIYLQRNYAIFIISHSAHAFLDQFTGYLRNEFQTTQASAQDENTTSVAVAVYSGI